MTANYWSLALGAVISSPLFFLLTLHLDRTGATQWLLNRDLAPVATADTARDLAGVIAGIDAAFITLYFSISLLVLTIAAGNLAVRLIDRWLAKRLVRVSIAGLSFTLIYAVLTMAAIDSEAELADTPLLTFAFTVAFLLVNIAMLAVALHDLGRSMFIDQEIDHLAQEAASTQAELEGTTPYSGSFAMTVGAPRNGYIEGVDLNRLERRLASHQGTVRICVAPGQHVFKGQALLALEHEMTDVGQIHDCIPIGPFRSNSQGAVFQIRLLVEIAARALSPAINDFYTALAAADALGEVMLGHGPIWVEEGLVPVRPQSPQIELPGHDYRGLFERPLAAFRQAAAPYPSVSIRMLGNIGRLITLFREQECPDGLSRFLVNYSGELAEQACQNAETERDRADIRSALQNVRHAADNT